jgi:predicted XRE-type DNA-binding protein
MPEDSKKIGFFAFPTDEFPCFGYVVCTEGNKQFQPVYDKDNCVYNFDETRFDTMYCLQYDGDRSITLGDKRFYAYLLLNNSKKPVFGIYEEIKEVLNKELDKIKRAPFSKFELAEFLEVDKNRLHDIKRECFQFLKKINKNYANKWAKENNYEINKEIGKNYDTVLDKIKCALFSKFEIAEFLEVGKKRLHDIKSEYFQFLEKLAVKRVIENKNNFNPEEEILPFIRLLKYHKYNLNGWSIDPAGLQPKSLVSRSTGNYNYSYENQLNNKLKSSKFKKSFNKKEEAVLCKL